MALRLEDTRGIWTDKSGFHNFFWLALMMVGGLGLSITLIVPITRSLFELELNFEAWFDAEESKYLDGIRFVQFWVSIGTFLIPALLMRHFARLGFKPLPGKRWIEWASFGFMFSAVWWIGGLSELMESIPWPGTWGEALLAEQANQDALVEKFLSQNYGFDFIFNLVVLAVLPAIGEEFLFRGTLIPLLLKKNKPWVAVLFSALVFALVHQQLIHFPGIFILGLFLSVIYFLTRNIWLVVGLHFLNNAWLIIWEFFDGPDQAHELIQWVALGVSIGLAALIYSKSKSSLD